MAKSSPQSSWLKLHASGEKALSKVLLKFFRAQNTRLFEAIGDTATAAEVKSALDLADERDAMLAAVRGPMLEFMATGALRVWKQRPKTSTPRRQKSAELDGFDLPKEIITAIEGSFAELEKESYWLDIQQTAVDSITGLVQRGIEEGMSGPGLAKFLRSSVGEMSKVRAAAIARTETTLAYNSGHQSGYDALAADGEDVRKEWLAVSDQDTRESHDEANGQTVGADEDFTVGGESCKYPGDASLSAEERVNCRCTTAAAFE